MVIQPGAVTAVDDLERVVIAALGAEPGSVVSALCGGAAVNASPLPAATPEPMPPSGSSPPTPPRSPAETRSASGSPPSATTHSGNRPDRARGHRLRRQARPR